MVLITSPIPNSLPVCNLFQFSKTQSSQGHLDQSFLEYLIGFSLNGRFLHLAHSCPLGCSFAVVLLSPLSFPGIDVLASSILHLTLSRFPPSFWWSTSFSSFLRGEGSAFKKLYTCESVWFFSSTFFPLWWSPCRILGRKWFSFRKHCSTDLQVPGLTTANDTLHLFSWKCFKNLFFSLCKLIGSPLHSSFQNSVVTRNSAHSMHRYWDRHVQWGFPHPGSPAEQRHAAELPAGINREARKLRQTGCRECSIAHGNDMQDA